MPTIPFQTAIQAAVNYNRAYGRCIAAVIDILKKSRLDYADNIEGFLPELKAEYGDKFDEIFDEENDNEETLVEDFARGFGEKTKSLLQECVEACLA